MDGGLGIEAPHALGDVRRFSHEAMATVFEVYVVHADERYAAQAAQAAFDLTDRLEQELSRFLSNSDITRVNHLAAGESTRVSLSTLECLAIARHVFDLTGGAFDVSIGTGLASLELDPDDSWSARRRAACRSTSVASARATRWIWMADCSRSGVSGWRSSTGDSVPSSHWSRRPAARAGR